jgi:hypothetical protein
MDSRPAAPTSQPCVFATAELRVPPHPIENETRYPREAPPQCPQVRKPRAAGQQGRPEVPWAPLGGKALTWGAATGRRTSPCTAAGLAGACSRYSAQGWQGVGGRPCSRLRLRASSPALTGSGLAPWLPRLPALHVRRESETPEGGVSARTRKPAAQGWAPAAQG